MTKVYDYIDYRKLLRDTIQSRKQVTPSLTFSKISDEIQVQRSYLSQVINGRGNLNSDQLYLIGQKLNLKKGEIEYITLLAEIEKCQVYERKQELKSQRDQVRSKYLKSEKYMDRNPVKVEAEHFARYYNDPYCSLVHMYLVIPKYRKTPALIKDKLNISDEKLREILDTLEKCAVIEYKQKTLCILKETLHLSDQSYLSKTNATMFRLKAIEHQQRSADEMDYFFTASIAANEDTRVELKKRFLEFLNEAAKLVEKSPSEEVFHLNFDLFRV